jgi:hypothetical protein
LAFGQQFSSLIGLVIQIYGSPLVYRTSHLIVLFSPRERSQRYLSSGDAETAHLQTIFWFYATEMQKMRIFMESALSVYLSHRGGWVEGDSILSMEQNNYTNSCKSPSTTSTFGKCRTEATTIIRNLPLCHTRSSILPCAMAKRHPL